VYLRGGFDSQLSCDALLLRGINAKFTLFLPLKVTGDTVTAMALSDVTQTGQQEVAEYRPFWSKVPWKAQAV
jgi:hypothetical protein